MEQMDRMRQGECQIFTNLIQYLASCRVTPFNGHTEQSSFMPSRSVIAFFFSIASQTTSWIFTYVLAHARIDRPSGASGFESCSISIQSYMADFSLARKSAVIDLSAIHQTSSYAAS